MMIGRELATEIHSAHSDASREPRYRFETLAGRGKIDPFDLDVRAGEVVGMRPARLGRTKRRNPLRRHRADSGTAEIEGRTVRSLLAACRNPEKFRLLPGGPQDRRIVGDLSVRENIVLALQARRGWTARSRRGAEPSRGPLHPGTRYPHRGSRETDHAAFRRQSAKGHSGALARDRTGTAHPDEPTRASTSGRMRKSSGSSRACARRACRSSSSPRK